MPHKKESTGEKIYSGTATVGRVMSVVGVVFGTVIGLIMIVVGIFMIVHHTKLTSQTQGTIEKGQNDLCTPYAKNNTTVWDCNFTVDYNVGGTAYKQNIILNDSSRSYHPGESIKIYYDPNNPDDSSNTSDETKIPGIILLVVGIVIPLGAWLWWYFARKYKAVAAAGGVAAGLDLLSGGRVGGIL